VLADRNHRDKVSDRIFDAAGINRSPTSCGEAIVDDSM
jgi:hypothetical protein